MGKPVALPATSQSDSSALFYIESPFGNIPAGSIAKNCSCDIRTQAYVSAAENLANVIQKQYFSELTFKDDTEPDLSQAELEAVRLAKQHTHFDSKQQRYETRILWIGGTPPDLKNTYSIAVRRFYTMERGLARQPPDVVAQVAASVEEHIQSGAYVPVPEDKYPFYTDPNNHKLFVLPPRVVYRLGHESTAVRLCLEGNQKAPGSALTLNNCILKGPSQLPNMLSLIHI